MTTYTPISENLIATEPGNGGEANGNCVVVRRGGKQPGIFCHSMATLMLENGADILFIQRMLGHSCLESTEVYTHVSVTQLKKFTS